MEKSIVNIFEDNMGLNLIKAHEEVIIAWENRGKELARQNRYVSMRRSHYSLSAEGLDEDEYEIEFSDISIDNCMVDFTLYSELPLANVVFSYSEGEQVSEYLYSMNGNPVMEMPEEYFNSPVSLTILYQKTLTQSIEFDEIVYLGL